VRSRIGAIDEHRRIDYFRKVAGALSNLSGET
jgi:hypothetical protein